MKLSRGNFLVTLGLTAVLSWPLAAPGSENSGSGSTLPSTVIPAAQVFSCGAGFTFMSVGISTHGNVMSLVSPAGVEHLLAFLIRNGYQVCHATAAGGPYTSSNDIGPTEAGWAAAVGVSQPNGPNTFPLEITRTTADGALTITRRITGNSFVAVGALFDLNGDGVSCSTMSECGNCTNRTIHVLTRVTNNTGVTQFVRIVEIADVDIASFGSIPREFAARTSDSATIFSTPDDVNPGNQGVLVQSLITPPLTAIAVFGGTPIDASCSVPSVVTPAPFGDYELAVRQDVTVGPFSTESGNVRIHYRRY